MGPPLAYVVCAAPLAPRSPELAGAIRDQGWDVTVVATPSAVEWIDADEVLERTGSPLVSVQRGHEEQRRGPRPRVVVACPLTFNTVNKLVAGISDTYALGVLNEAVSTGTPTIGVPLMSGRLWHHPALTASLATLGEWGVSLLDPATGEDGPRPVVSGDGARVASAFQADWLLNRLQKLGLLDA